MATNGGRLQALLTKEEQAERNLIGGTLRAEDVDVYVDRLEAMRKVYNSLDRDLKQMGLLPPAICSIKLLLSELTQELQHAPQNEWPCIQGDVGALSSWHVCRRRKGAWLSRRQSSRT